MARGEVGFAKYSPAADRHTDTRLAINADDPSPTDPYKESRSRVQRMPQTPSSAHQWAVSTVSSLNRTPIG